MSIGYPEKVLWVNLTEETLEEEKISEKTMRQYLGGYGLAAKLIYENTPKNYDPLGSDAVFGFFPGLFTGTAAPLSGRYMVAGKSPLTGTWGDANSGGTAGPEIKRCGYDGILVKGMANSPKYVALVDGKEEILDASEIWGLDIIEAEEKLKKRHGKFIKTAGIGQAGENVSLIAGIANDKGRIAARSGIGAVMGSKKLKMLVLKGENKVPIDDRKTFMNLVKEYNKTGKVKDPGRIMSFLYKTIPKMAKIMRRFKVGMSGPSGMIRDIYHSVGTCLANTLSAETGDSPIKNWGGIGMYDFPYKISKDLSSNNILQYKVRDYGCFSCPVQCGGILSIPELDLEETHQPEYETSCSFGALLLNHDLISLFKINEICNRAAIDSISAGATIGFAMDCYENGLLSNEDLDGLDLKWGNSEAIVSLLEKMIKREGIGDILADGSRAAAKKIGKGSKQFAMTSLGQEIAMHNPRIFPSLAFSYAYDPTPGRHTTASIDFVDIGPVDKFEKTFKFPEGYKKDYNKRLQAQKLTTALQQDINCLGLCMFSTLFGPYPLIDLIKAQTTWQISSKEGIETGIRIQTLRQAFTIREGIEISQNSLPGRVVGDPPDQRGPTKGISIEYKDFYKDYCKEMGWNPENGYPLEKTLKDLDLEFVIKDLY